MISIKKKFFIFSTIEIHSADKPYNVKGYDQILFQYCKNPNNGSEFTFIKPHNTAIIDLTQDLETIRSNFSSNTKRSLNIAARENFTLEINKNHDEFYNLYKSFLIKKKLGPFNGLFNIFNAGIISLETIKTNGTLITVKHNDELIIGDFLLETPNEIILFANASKRLQSDKEKSKIIGIAHRFLLWEAIKYAKNKGIKEFDFGGIFSEGEVKNDSQKKGIREFKMKFGPKKITRYQYQKINSTSLKYLFKIYKKYNEIF